MAYSRRSFLRFTTFGCAYCLTHGLAGADAAHADAGAGGGHAAPHWSYEGETGPGHWGELSPDFKVCQLGLQQTPIDLSSGVEGKAEPLAFDYHPLALRLINNGHTIQINADPGSFLQIGETKYELVQFHFHHPSEHLVDGRAFDLEIHFVHKSAAGTLAVVGVFVAPGARNPKLDPVFDQMPAKEGPEVRGSGVIDPAALLPAKHAYYRYMGSLTTPPCSEGLTWTVFRDPIEASPEQVRKFAALFPNNARPVQQKNGRSPIETAF